ncbi:MAG TPA: DUF4337 domain-containing protein [Chloroflexota bacterium]|nr:DUF4337 domain-containing protein [Chloroflexota bacterium]
MDVTEAADTIKEVGAEHEAAATGLRRFENQAALLIAFLAMFLAITSVAGNDNLQAILQSETEIADTWAFYQAKNIRRTSTILAKDQVELLLLGQSAAWSPEARAAAEAKLAAYEADIDRYRNEPEEGTVDLQNKARDLEARREHALKQDPNFDFAEGLFQIAIVIASVSIITKVRPFLYAAAAMGAVALLLMLNGFFLFTELPI